MNYFRLSFIFILIFFSQSIYIKASPKSKGEKPNIIFILTDDQRWDALGYSGNKIIQTPEMDKLARSGVYFKNAIVTTPICSASRVSIFSGVQERTHKYTFQSGDIRSDLMETSYPKVLKQAGYYTGFYGKFGVNYPEKDKLFDVIEDYDRANQYKDYRGYYYKTLNGDTVHLTRYTGQKAIDFIDDVPDDQPFSLSLSFSAPHAHDGAPLQYFWQEESDKLYQNRNMPEPELADEKYFNALPKIVRDGFNRLRWYWKNDTPEKYQHSTKGYYRMINGVDREIAKIREKLEEKGLDENTVIILMGDNGFFLGERQISGKWLMYDNSIRVPLIVYDPRVKQHKDIEDMALNTDVPATIADLAGVEAPESWQGKSLMPLVTGKQKSIGRDTILVEHLWEFKNIPPSEGVRTNEWKYFRYVNDKSLEELYNLKDDPKETNNLASNPKYKNVLLEFRTKNDELGQRYADPYSGVPTGLMIEFIREPAKSLIVDRNPEFTWIVPASSEKQTAYQIIVASSLQNIREDIGDVWDSGKVSDSNSVEVEFNGKSLREKSDYYWKVKVWGTNETESPYSEYQVFTTGEFRGYSSTKNCFQSELITPSRIEQIANNHYFIDFGKDAFGTLQIELDSPADDTIIVHLGEKLLDNQIDKDPPGTIRYQKVKLAVKSGNHKYLLDLPADRRNTEPRAIQLPDSFGVIMPFRYCELENCKADVSKNNIRQKAYWYYFDDEQSHFESSDTILNQIWDICKYSMKATSFTGLYVDGDRERIPYEGDALINQLGHYCTDREYSIARRTNEYFIDHATWFTEWVLHTLPLFYYDYMYTGNIESVEYYYEELKIKALLDMAREDGLICSGSGDKELLKKIGFSGVNETFKALIDWPPKSNWGGKTAVTKRVNGERDNYDLVEYNTVVNSFHYSALKIMEGFAEKLNKTEDAKFFSQRALKVKAAINATMFDFEKGIYLDGEGSEHSSLHANMFPLALGVVPKEHVKSVTEFIMSRGMVCSVYGAQYLLEALYKAGEADFAFDLLTATHDRSWWNMIAVGSTITLEAWDLNYKNNLDWNHAWGAAPANIIPRYMWGIKPIEPGFGKAIIQPQLSSLKSSEITCPTIRGNIIAAYIKGDGIDEFIIQIPANMECEFVIPNNEYSSVLLNKELKDVKHNKITLSSGMNHIIINQ